MAAVELVTYVAKSLVDDPDAVTVEVDHVNAAHVVMDRNGIGGRRPNRPVEPQRTEVRQCPGLAALLVDDIDLLLARAIADEGDALAVR